MGRLDDKIAIITGGTSGIGEASVKLFAQEGATVIIAARSVDKGNRLAEQLGKNVFFMQTDVSQEEQVKAVIDYAKDKFGRLDCIFNNAGDSTMPKPIDQIPTDEFERFIKVHLLGVFWGIKYSAPIMKAQKSGSIINMASTAGMVSAAGHYPYVTCKAAVIHLSRTVAMELGEHGIKVNCISPGAIATPIFTNQFEVVPDQEIKAMEAVKAQLSKQQPLPIAGLPEDIADAALWLAGTESRFVNGHNLVIDGGLTGGKGWSSFHAERNRIFTEIDKSINTE